ncbi:MAG: YggS family pyridoxal phosphate-dependent enzyme [Acidobacteriota bacterium]
MATIAENVASLMERIRRMEKRSGRGESSVRLLAATKMVAPERIREAIAAGIDLVGENRVQEAESKRGAISKQVEFHMIGHLQGNKARRAVTLFDCIESIDSLDLARKVAAEKARAGGTMRVMLELNLGGEDSKSGFEEDDLRAHFEKIRQLEGLTVKGLMALPPYVEPEEARPYFQRLRRLGEELFGRESFELSMGMSHDFEVAVEEGATIVRIGTAIFGERHY